MVIGALPASALHGLEQPAEERPKDSCSLLGETMLQLLEILNGKDIPNEESVNDRGGGVPV